MKLIIVIFGILLLNTSCRNFYYIPNTPNVFLPEEKGDGEITVAVSEGVDLQASYTPIDKFGLMLNHNTYEFDHGNGNSEKGRTTELGLGWYGSSLNSYFRYSIFGGFGRHSYKGDYEFPSDFARLKANKSFIQTNLGITGRVLELSVFYRYSNISYSSINYQVNEELNLGDRLYLDALDEKKDLQYETLGSKLSLNIAQFKLSIFYIIKARENEMPSLGNELFIPNFALSIGYRFKDKKQYEKNPEGQIKKNIWNK